jgi:small multidrug resistance family-3 protein
MKTSLALLLLVFAAALEAGGDALVRGGLFGPTPWRRAVLLAGGALALLAYGCCVNLPRWDFGRLLGVSVAAFFVVAQVINGIGFGQKPALPLCVGGGLIVGGGLVITLWRA